MNRIALLVGIDHYPTAPLAGCVNDALTITHLLETNQDGSPNFHARPLVSSDATISRSTLRREVHELFSREADVALLFFAGHGTATNLDGYLVSQDVTAYDEGVPMGEVLQMANTSPASERIVLLDCCYSGVFGNPPAVDNRAVLNEGVTVLTATRNNEVALEQGGGGLFTSHVAAALSGGAADVCGKVTSAGVYAYLDEVLSGWDQRPLMKSHVSRLATLRKCSPAVELEILRRLPEYFPSPDREYPLDPSFEPTEEPEHEGNERVFNELQKLRAARLVEPVGHEHLYYAALESGSCRLTPLGQYYLHRVTSHKI